MNRSDQKPIGLLYLWVRETKTLLTEQLFQPKLCAAWTFQPRQPCHSNGHFLMGGKNYKLDIQSDVHFPEFSASDNLFSHQSFSILAKMMECFLKKPWDSTFLIWNKMTKLLEPGWHQLITTSTGLSKLHGHIRLADQQADFDAAIQEMRVKMEREQELLAAVQGVYGNTWYFNKTVMVPEAKCEDLYREFLNLPLRSYRRREPNACKAFICSWFVLSYSILRSNFPSRLLACAHSTKAGTILYALSYFFFINPTPQGRK